MARIHLLDTRTSNFGELIENGKIYKSNYELAKNILAEEWKPDSIAKRQ